MRIIATVAAEETGLGSRVYCPLQYFHFAHILQMEIALFHFQVWQLHNYDIS